MNKTGVVVCGIALLLSIRRIRVEISKYVAPYVTKWIFPEPASEDQRDWFENATFTYLASLSVFPYEGAAVLYVHEGSAMFLTYTDEKTGQRTCAIPGGKPKYEDGASPRATATRELAEEAGVVVAPDERRPLTVLAVEGGTTGWPSYVFVEEFWEAVRVRCQPQEKYDGMIMGRVRRESDRWVVVTDAGDEYALRKSNKFLFEQNERVLTQLGVFSSSDVAT